MTRETYRLIENYMLEYMDPHDYAHGPEHVYRVLNAALDIAAHEENVDINVLICACLLHDIARKAQAENPAVRHASAGAEMARAFLLDNGFGAAFADHVAACIRVHSTHDDRGDFPFGSIEAKILFDADKLDAAGALGVARTLQYGAQFAGEPLYSRSEGGEILDGSEKVGKHSFMHEYHFNLKPVYCRFHTARAAKIASNRRQIAEAFYESLLAECRETDRLGELRLQDALD